MRSCIGLVLSLGSVLLSLTLGAPQGGSDGSKCPNVSCSPPLPGAQCTARYERDDGCCPVWYCNQNGATSTIYGKSTGSSSSSSSSSFSSSSYGNSPQQSSSSYSSSSGSGGFAQMPSFGGFQIQLPTLGGLFG